MTCVMRALTVFNNGNLLAMVLVEDMVDKRGLAGAKEACKVHDVGIDGLLAKLQTSQFAGFTGDYSYWDHSGSYHVGCDADLLCFTKTC
jgi:hypothetical protein